MYSELKQHSLLKWGNHYSLRKLEFILILVITVAEASPLANATVAFPLAIIRTVYGALVGDEVLKVGGIRLGIGLGVGVDHDAPRTGYIFF